MVGGGTRPRRDRILAAASREFADHGFAGARMDRIAASAGVNKQLLFHYFGSKDGLHKAALGSVLHPFGPASETSGPPAERLRDLIAQLAAATDEHPALLALLSTTSGRREATSEAAAMADNWRSSASLHALQILQTGQRAGYFRDDLDLEAISEVIVGASLAWTASGDRHIAGRNQKYRETLLKMVADYCTWR